MRLRRALFLSTVFAIGCCTYSTLALPNIFRRQASDGPLDASARSEVELLNLDPVEQVAIFGDANRARELYRTATKEKIALIRYWHQKVQEVVTSSDAERLDRQDWFKQMIRLKEQWKGDLQEQRLAFQALVTEHTEKANSVVDSLQNLEVGATSVIMTSSRHGQCRVRAFGMTAERNVIHADLTPSMQVASQLKHVVDEHGVQIERSVQQHFSKATDLMEANLAAPLQSLHQAALMLESHTLALGLALQQQDGLVSDLTLLSSEMLSLQRENHAQLESELDALRRIHTGFEAINRGLHASQASLDVLLSTQRSSASSILNSVGFALEGMVLWSLRQLESSTGLGFGNSESQLYISVVTETLKLKASIMVSTAIFKALAATIVLLAMLLKSIFQPLSLYIIRPLRRSGNGVCMRSHSIPLRHSARNTPRLGEQRLVEYATLENPLSFRSLAGQVENQRTMLLRAASGESEYVVMLDERRSDLEVQVVPVTAV
ncbi:hypothetical protein PHSY_003387 [Pseudozyma hubeiensis SY62]|uniref:Uncharacterized protein n=1 Tax=Pseudozyma hubeiensis (strain SY62) TaxID=1305764 RepID=R9PCM2_PSEHS|nr:hypothetical protein PHSY_003387 [Pseudozyma hubeiensis SY62]GAC95810.1 hypothetical protein PHSY_003387 [Pseudozyma hubeiensis SY62]